MANKNSKLQYVIKTVPSESTLPLQNLLNEMAEDGWDLYSMSEVETDDGFQFNCIFVKEADVENSFESDYEIAAQNIIEYIKNNRELDIKNKLRELLVDLFVGGSIY